jgi:thymidylate kinase
MPDTPSRAGAPHGAIIAVVGSDGSGKSTLTADLLTELGKDRPTELIYLGQSSGMIVDWVRGLPLIGPAVGRYLMRRGERAHVIDDKPAAPDGLTALVVHLLSRWRYHKFKRMLRLSRRGLVVVTDRYPQAEAPGFYFDGPGLNAKDAPKGFVRWLASREQRLYERMARHLPALLIRLNVDAETAHARKPDHKLSMLRDKARVIPMLRFNGAHILDLDGRSNYPQVLEKALSSAREAIANRR